MTEDIREITLAGGEKIMVRFICLFADPSGPAYYPQAIRAWPQERAEKLQAAYEEMAQHYANQLASMIKTSPDYIFAPLSRHPFARAILNVIRYRKPDALDISKRFQKVCPDIVASENDTNAEDVYRSLKYAAAGDEASIKSILMVDDVVAGEKTTFATFSHLVEAGMSIGSEVTVASLLRVNAG